MVTFDVEFYQENKEVNGSLVTIDHEAELMNQITQKGFSPVIAISTLKTSGLTIHELDFIIYAMYTEQDSRLAGSQYYVDMEELALDRIAVFEKRFIFNTTIQNIMNSIIRRPNRTYTEHYGVSTALLLNNEIFGLTRADYEAIPSSKKSKTLDFSNAMLSSTGVKFVITEAKGVSDIDANINAQAKSIIEKKKQSNATNIANTLFYGVIARIPYSDQPSNGLLTVVDPESPFKIDIDPLKFKLQTRLRYYINRIQLFGNTKQIKELLNVLREMIEVDSRNWQERYTSLVRRAELDYKINPFNYLCTYIELDGRIIGRLFKNETSENHEYLFYGFYEKILETLENPTIENVNNMKYELQYNVALEDIEMHYKYYNPTIELDSFKASGFVNIYETGEVLGLFKRNIGNA